MRYWQAATLLLLGLGLLPGREAHAQRGAGGAHGGLSGGHTGFSSAHAAGGSFGSRPGFASRSGLGSLPGYGSRPGFATRPGYGGPARSAFRSGPDARFAGSPQRFASSPQRFAPGPFRNTTSAAYGRGPSPTRPQFFSPNRNSFAGNAFARNGFGERIGFSRFGFGRYGFLGYYPFDPFLLDDSFLYPFWDDGWNPNDQAASTDPNAFADPAFATAADAPAPDSNLVSYRAPAPQPTTASAPDEEAALTLVFRDGRPSEQIHNYALTRTTLYVTGRRTREIPVDQLDLPATERVNRAAGVSFQLP